MEQNWRAGKKTGQNGSLNPAAAAPNAGAPAGADEELLTSVADEIVLLYREGKLPEGFDAERAFADPALAALILSEGIPVEYAVRIYIAEKKAAEAEQSARQRVTDEVRQRGALPRPQRAGVAVQSGLDYRGMSSEEFRQLEQQYKRAAKNGRRVVL